MSCILYFLFLSTFLYKKKLNIFDLWIKYFFVHFKQNAGTGINTLMSISDGSHPSIFCRKMEKARPMREEMDGKAVYHPQSRHSDFDAVI